MSASAASFSCNAIDLGLRTLSARARAPQLRHGPAASRAQTRAGWQAPRRVIASATFNTVRAYGARRSLRAHVVSRECTPPPSSGSTRPKAALFETSANAWRSRSPIRSSFERRGVSRDAPPRAEGRTRIRGVALACGEPRPFGRSGSARPSFVTCASDTRGTSRATSTRASTSSRRARWRRSSARSLSPRAALKNIAAARVAPRARRAHRRPGPDRAPSRSSREIGTLDLHADAPLEPRLGRLRLRARARGPAARDLRRGQEPLHEPGALASSCTTSARTASTGG